jgi:predicted nucleic acid-binding protein
MIIVDASVAVKWFLPEQRTDAAQAILLGSDKLMAPALIRVEVAAAITRKVRLGELLSQEAEAACYLWFRALSTAVVTLSPDQNDLPAAVALALQVRHPLQDCLYLALAVRNQSALITADPKFAERAAHAYAKVQLLA